MEPKIRKKRQIHDWDKLKLDFLASDCPTVQDYIRENNLPWNGNTAHKTTGWIGEKQKYRHKIIDKIKNRSIEEISKKTVKEIKKGNDKKGREEIRGESETLCSSIVSILKRQASIADLLLFRVETMLKDNKQVYGVIKGHKIVGELNPTNIKCLANAASIAADLQCKAEGIDPNESGDDQSDKLAIQKSILERVSEVRTRGAD